MAKPLTTAQIALAYLEGGWHPIELPAGAKAPPPEGRTGAGGSDLTEAEVRAAAWDGNLGLRMPPDVIGLDVDAYHGGQKTLLALLRSCGPLPSTWIAHSARNDGSGIRFFRVPVGLAWVAGLAGIEIIQRGHRYAVVYPSIHPEGRAYGWVDQNELTFTVEFPAVEALPELPWAWIATLSRSMVTEIRSPARAAEADEVEEFLAANNASDQAGYVHVILSDFDRKVAAGHSRHDSMVHALLWAVETIASGIAPGRATIDLFARRWVDAVTPDARRAEITSPHRVTEFQAMLRHAVGKVRGKPEAQLLEFHDEIAGPPMGLSGRRAEVTARQIDVDQADDQEDEDDGLPRPLDWQAFSQRDTAAGPRWLVDGFWPWGRAMALWAGAKTGKSELALWCAAKLALGEHPWTGVAVEPVDIAYFDFEMTVDDLDDRLSDFGIDPLRLGRLHYFLLPAIHALDVEAGGREVEALVGRCGAQGAIFDTFGRAVGGDENEADTVRAFYRHTGSRLKRMGVGYLRTDHAGKDRSKGQRGSSAKRDDVDVVWSMERGRSQGVVLLDCSGSSRLSWVGPHLKIDRLVAADETVSYASATTFMFPAGTAAMVALLDSIGVPADAGRPTAEKMLRAVGHGPGKKRTLEAAVRLRRTGVSKEIEVLREEPKSPPRSGLLARLPEFDPITGGAAIDPQPPDQHK
jgi:hypothetical protein